VISPDTGKIIWRVPKYYRLAGPFSVSISEDGRYLNVVAIELTSERDRYLWRSNLIDVKTGELLATIDLPKFYLVSSKKVITWTGDRSFSLRTTEKDIYSVGFE
jgi:hypothetical protein